MNFKEEYGSGTITHFHFLNDGYSLLGIYNLPHVLLGNFMYYFV